MPPGKSPGGQRYKHTSDSGGRHHKHDSDCNGGPMPLLPPHENNHSKPFTEKFDCKEFDVENGYHVHYIWKKLPLYRRTKLEVYLMGLCLLLFCACIAFIVIAFTRDGGLSNIGMGPYSLTNTAANGRFHSNLTNPPVCVTDHCVRTAASLLNSMDLTADPCEDFFQFACGTWNKKHVIPEDKSTFNTFEKLYDDLQVTLKVLLEEKYKEKRDSGSMLEAKRLYKSCMNTSEIEKLGGQPIQSAIASYGGWPVTMESWDADSFDLEQTAGNIRRDYNLQVLMDCWIAADDKNSTVHVIQFDQPGLGMPSREYYIDEVYLKPYKKYMIEAAILLGANSEDAEESMTKVLDFEITLANATLPQSMKHDTGAIYKKMSVKDLQKAVPEFNWVQYLQHFLRIEFTEEEQVVVLGLDYFKRLGVIIKNTDKKVLADYIMWRLVLMYTPQLSEPFRLQDNNYRKILQGISREKVRWMKCVGYVNEKIGMAVGAMFVHNHFKKESKDTALEMIQNIRAAFNELLQTNEWMDDETKAVAMEKANAMNERIGYPEFILNHTALDKLYDGLHFSEDNYFQNVIKVNKFQVQKMVEKLREPVRKEAWEQEPAVVNAFYSPNTNDIVFPAGILQPLFYSQHFPKSLNYGGIGVVIGHEITHGFDDKGRQYDKNGNLKQWWKNKTIAQFRKKTKCIEEQYSRYKLPGINMNIDGKNTEGENIADNGGIKEAFRAYRKWVEKNGEEEPLPGINLTHNQLFFLNYAQIWCGNMRDEEAIHKIRTSVHSPGLIRVLGPLSNSYDFAKAYNCPKGSRMNPVSKCQVW